TSTSSTSGSGGATGSSSSSASSGGTDGGTDGGFACTSTAPPGSVEWTTAISLAGLPGGSSCSPITGMCTPCPAYGTLGGLVVGTSGEAFAAVPWGSCGEPNAGPDGIGIFGIDPSGKVSTLDDVLDASDTGFMQCLSLGGSPPSLLSFGIAGASHWMTTFYVNQCEYNAASSTMPSVGTQVTTSVFSNPAAYVEGDAAGNTFVDLYWSNLPSNAVFKYDTTGKEVWSVFGMPPQVRLGPEMVADGQGGVYVLASAA